MLRHEFIPINVLPLPYPRDRLDQVQTDGTFELPSGSQVPDLLNDYLELLWLIMQENKPARKPTTPRAPAVSARMTATPPTGETDDADMDPLTPTIESQDGVDVRCLQSEGPADTLGSLAGPGTADGSRSDSAESTPGDRPAKGMPDNWVPTYLLAFLIHGPPGHNHEELSKDFSNGPKRKDPPSVNSSNWLRNPAAAKRSASAGETKSKAQLKRERREEVKVRAAERAPAVQQDLADSIASGMIHVKNVAHNLAEMVDINRKRAEVAALTRRKNDLKDQIHFAKDMGDEDEQRRLMAEFRDLCRPPDNSGHVQATTAPLPVLTPQVMGLGESQLASAAERPVASSQLGEQIHNPQKENMDPSSVINIDEKENTTPQCGSKVNVRQAALGSSVAAPVWSPTSPPGLNI